MKLDTNKSVKVTSLHSKVLHPVTINREIVPQIHSVKYLGIHLHSKLNWAEPLNWLVENKLPLALDNKRLLCILNPSLGMR